jgi:hypothetical protein
MLPHQIEQEPGPDDARLSGGFLSSAHLAERTNQIRIRAFRMHRPKLCHGSDVCHQELGI